MTGGSVAFCPGHISGYFKRVMGQDAASTGSSGAGIVISEGVLARVAPSNQTFNEFSFEYNYSSILLSASPVKTAMIFSAIMLNHNHYNRIWCG